MKELPLHVCDEQLTRRISGEYLEMPGLQLTCRQAQRLFGLSQQVCMALLDDLVRRKFLAQRPDGRYVRLTEGQAGGDSTRQPRGVASAHLNDLLSRTA